MKRLRARFHDQSVLVGYPPSLEADVESLLQGLSGEVGGESPQITIVEMERGSYRLISPYRTPEGDMEEQAVASRGQVLADLLDEIVRALIHDLKSAVALHAGAVSGKDGAIVVAGPTGVGKTSLVAWLASQVFDYLSDEAVLLDDAGNIVPLMRPLVVKAGAQDRVMELPIAAECGCLPAGERTLLVSAFKQPRELAHRCGLVVFVEYVPDAALSVRPLSPAQTAFRLMACNLNARNLADHGLRELTTFASRTPAIVLCYSDFDQLPGTVDELARVMLDRRWAAGTAYRFLSAFGERSQEPRPAAPQRRPIPAPTAKRLDRKLTVGMATYDDFDGVFFTIQALRLFHREILDDIEFLVIDNHPDGPCGEALKNFENTISNYRYVPSFDRNGTAIRDRVFAEASGKYVLCIDCHVLVAPGRHSSAACLLRRVSRFDRPAPGSLAP